MSELLFYTFFAAACAYVILVVGVIVLTLLRAAIGALKHLRHANDVPTSENLPDMPDAVVTLVHGTWASRADWTMPKSPLYEVIGLSLGSVVMRPFRWSGRNRVWSRLTATDELRRDLHGALARWPNAAHFVIAHSHGGNIAVHALKDLELRSRITGVVCLSTPFLLARRRPVSDPIEATIFWMPSLFAMLTLSEGLKRVSPEWLNYPKALLLLATSIVIGLLFRGFVLLRSESILAMHSLPRLSRNQLLIVTTVGDEASVALGATQLLSRCIGALVGIPAEIVWASVQGILKFRQVLENHMSIVMTVVCAPAVGVMIVGGIEGFERNIALFGMLGVALLGAIFDWMGAQSAVLKIGGLAFACLVAPFTALFMLLGLPFGLDFAFTAPLIEIAPALAPPGDWRVLQIGFAKPNSVGSKYTGLSHSFTYDDHDTLLLIQEWIQQRTRHKVNLPGE